MWNYLYITARIQNELQILDFRQLILISFGPPFIHSKYSQYYSPLQMHSKHRMCLLSDKSKAVANIPNNRFIIGFKNAELIMAC